MAANDLRHKRLAAGFMGWLDRAGLMKVVAAGPA